MTGIRVLELAGLGPAPYAGMVLADLGAQVIRVDRPRQGEPPVAHPRFDFPSLGRTSVVVDLKRPGAADVVLRLVERCAVLVEGFRPGVAERLGLGPAECTVRNPALVYARMTGWGQDGPLAGTAGHDINYLALSGALHNLRAPDGRPVPPNNLLGDFGAGAMYLLVAILSALRVSERTGRGQVIDAAIVDGCASMLTMQHGMMAAGLWDADRPGGNILDGGAPFYRVYETADDRYVAVGAIEAPFYAALVGGLGLDLAELPPQLKRRYWPGTIERFAAVFTTRTRDQWWDIYRGTDACVTPVLSPAEAAVEPQLAARGTYRYTATGHLRPAPAPRLLSTPTRASDDFHPAGAGTRGVLEDAGYLSGDIEALIQRGVVADH